MTWLAFALLTVCSWGVYGVLLHTGVMAMSDPVNGRYKAFLFVGVAYLLVAVIGSLVVLKINGVAWESLPAKGVAWSTEACRVDCWRTLRQRSPHTSADRCCSFLGDRFCLPDIHSGLPSSSILSRRCPV